MALAPASTVVWVATFAAWILGLLLVGALLAGGGCLPGCVGFVVAAVIVAAVDETGSQLGASRVLLPLLTLLVTVSVRHGDRGPAAAQAKPEPATPPEPPRRDLPRSTEPFEFVSRRGEAADYVPGLYLTGEPRALAVAIECKAADGSLLRRVTLPLEAATRETAAQAVRMAKAPDLEYAAERARKEAEAAAAAAALERLDELERSRRSLPE